MKNNQANNSGTEGEKQITDRLQSMGVETFSKGPEVSYPRPCNPSGKGKMDNLVIINGKIIHVEVKFAREKGGSANEKWDTFAFNIFKSQKLTGYNPDFAIMVILGPCKETSWGKHKVVEANRSAEVLGNDDKVKVMFEDEFFKWIEEVKNVA